MFFVLKILLERGAVSSGTMDLLKKQYSNVKREMLSSGSQFYSSSKTLNELASGCYFKNKNGDVEWPEVFALLKNGKDMKIINYSIGKLKFSEQTNFENY